MFYSHNTNCRTGWNNFRRLQDLTRDTIVEAEIGGNYMDSSTTFAHIDLASFLAIAQEQKSEQNEEIHSQHMFVAQQDVSLLPITLQKDLETPIICSTTG